MANDVSVEFAVKAVYHEQICSEGLMFFFSSNSKTIAIRNGKILSVFYAYDKTQDSLFSNK